MAGKSSVVRKAIGWIPGARRLYRYLHLPEFLADLPTYRRQLRERGRELMLGQAGVLRKFSLEFTTVGRNDDYTPDWLPKLESIVAYNRRLFASSDIDFRVAFVEWNPPKDRPRLAPYLVEKYPYLRAIIVDPDIHNELCQFKRLNVMFGFAANAAFRTSAADFILLSCAEDYLGRDVARWLLRRGLRKECLYRAVRVDIRRDFDFRHPDVKAVEARGNVVGVRRVREPPYYHYCGDFILMDRVSMQRIRGFDESLRRTNGGVDERLCASAMALGLSCRLIGHIYHIDHDNSSCHIGDQGDWAGYRGFEGIPYQNPETWGLFDRNWKNLGRRLTCLA